MATLGSVSPVGVPAACRLPRLATAFRPFTPTAARAMPLVRPSTFRAEVSLIVLTCASTGDDRMLRDRYPPRPPAQPLPQMQQQQQSAQRLARPLTRVAASSSPDALATGSPPPADTAAKEPALKGEAHLRFVRGSPLKVGALVTAHLHSSLSSLVEVPQCLGWMECCTATLPSLGSWPPLCHPLPTRCGACWTRFVGAATRRPS